MAAGLTAAISWVGEQLPVYAVNLVMTTGTDLWAVRYPATHELYVLERPAGGTVAADALEARSSRIHARSDQLAEKASVLVATERLDEDPAWRLLGDGVLVHVNVDLEVDTSSPFPAPRHLLTRADLDAASEASQHPQRVVG